MCKNLRAVFSSFCKKVMSSRTRGVSLDFKALSHYGVDSNKTAITKAIKAGKSKPKALVDSFDKENLGYWSDPDSKEYFSNFSSKCIMSDDVKNQNGSSDAEEQNSTLIAKTGSRDANEELNSGQNSVVSEVSLVAKDDDTLDSPVKNTQKVIQRKQCGCKTKMSMELKSKLEEEKDLKKEVDKLEYEVMQSEKVQDNIDKLREKLRNLRKRKQGESKKSKRWSKVKTSENGNHSQLNSNVRLACQKAMQYAGITEIIDLDDFVSELMERASLRHKKHRDSRRTRKEKYQLSPSSSSSESSLSSSSSLESESENPKRRSSKAGGASRGIKYNTRARTKSRSRSRSLS